MGDLEIRELRERYGASQKAFVIILGFGQLTINFL
jgi:DNA-binding transcriptional regulator YiaG